MPIIATRLPVRSASWSQRAEWKTLPGKSASPGMSGVFGSESGPVAETTTSATTVVPLALSMTQFSASLSQRIIVTSWFSLRCGRSPKVSATCSR